MYPMPANQSKLTFHQVVESRLVKEMGGIKWVISGVDDKGKLIEPDCLMQELIILRTKGMQVEVPTQDGGTKVWTVKVFSSNWSADWLAKQALLPFAESTSANQCCSDCKWISLAARERWQKGAQVCTSAHAQLIPSS
jgi:hypothetical protein